MDTTQPLSVFHVTHADNMKSILKHGLDPRKRYPARIATRSYFIVTHQLMWAIAHVSGRMAQSVDRLVVLRFDTITLGYPSKYKKMGFLPGVYYCDVAGIKAEYVPVPANRLTEWYEVGGGIIESQIWRLQENEGMG